MGILQAIGKGFAESTKILKVALIFFAFNFVIGLVMLPFAGPENAGNPQAAGVALLVSIVSVLAFVFLQGGALAVIRDLLKKNTFSLSDFIANGKKYYVKILGLFVAVIGIALIAILLLALVAALFFVIANNPFTRALVAAVVTVVSIVAAVLLLFPIYIIVLEEAGPIEAIKKGVSTSIKHFWKTLGLLLVLFLVTFGIAFVIGLITAVIAGVLPVASGQIVTLFVNSVLQSYLSIVMMVALMVFYLALGSSQAAKQGPAPTT